MITLRALALFMIMIAVIAGSIVTVGANGSPTASQSAGETNNHPSLALSVALPQRQVPAGKAPTVQLTVRNLTNEDVPFPETYVHVEGANGEPPTTLRQRQLTHRLKPGEPALMAGGFEPLIGAGASSTRKYDLGKLYDLIKPGKYSVYIEALDVAASKDNAGVWVRSNTVDFEIQAPAQ